MISLVVAASDNHVIGQAGQLPWHLPADLKHFKNLTWGMPVIMGRKTFESIGKPLPGRINIVISSQTNSIYQGIEWASSPEQALKLAEASNCLEVFVIGGGHIYQQFMPKANNIYLTRVHTRLEGDTFFPDPDPNQWALSESDDRMPDEKNRFSYSFQVWKRK